MGQIVITKRAGLCACISRNRRSPSEASHYLNDPDLCRHIAPLVSKRGVCEFSDPDSAHQESVSIVCEHYCITNGYTLHVCTQHIVWWRTWRSFMAKWSLGQDSQRRNGLTGMYISATREHSDQTRENIRYRKITIPLKYSFVGTWRVNFVALYVITYNTADTDLSQIYRGQLEIGDNLRRHATCSCHVKISVES